VKSFWWWVQAALAVPALLFTIWFAAVGFTGWLGWQGALPTVVYAAVLGRLFVPFFMERRK
jgi:hypothetical protein